jgi:hypothetical protein
LNEKVARTEVDSSRLTAWAFTRLSYKGYPQCLGKRKRSRLLTFFLQAKQKLKNIKNYEKNYCILAKRDTPGSGHFVTVTKYPDPGVTRRF